MQGIKLQPPENYFTDAMSAWSDRPQHVMEPVRLLKSEHNYFNFAPVSEEPVVSIGGDLTGLEFTNSNVDGSDHQVALSNVTFSIADAGAVASADAKIEVKAADGVVLFQGYQIDINRRKLVVASY